MAYLASPYSPSDPAVRQQPYVAACSATAELLRAGKFVCSPIVHNHRLVEHTLPSDEDFWQCFNCF
jgi:hypothetical protein